MFVCVPARCLVPPHCPRALVDVCAGPIKLPSGCISEQAAAEVLGYTQSSWDSGKEKQPASAKKYWGELTSTERVAAVFLGYNEKVWDKGGKKHRPASAKKYWAQLTACGEWQCHFDVVVLSTKPASMHAHRIYHSGFYSFARSKRIGADLVSLPNRFATGRSIPAH